MPQIPYTPHPTVQSSDAGSAQFNLHVTPDMFGLGVAKALSGLGTAVGNLGDVASKHAVEFQNQQNEIDSTNAQIDGMTKMAEETNKLKMLSGDEATKYMPTYKANLQKIFDDSMKGAPNKAVGLMVQKALKQQLGGHIMSGSEYATRQMKVAQVAGANALTATSTVAAGGASDDKTFDNLMSEAEKNAEAGARADGQTETASIDAAKQVARNGAIDARVRGMVLADPEKATEILKKYGDKLSPDKKTELEGLTQNALNVTGARRVADKITSGQVPGKDPILEMISGGESGGNYNRLVNKTNGQKVEADLTNMTVAQVIELQSGMIKNGHPTTALGKYQIIKGTLLGALDEAGVSMDDKFNAATQDKVAKVLFDRRVRSAEERGEDPMVGLGNEWEILKKDAGLRGKVSAALKNGGSSEVAAVKPLNESSTTADLDAALKAGRDYAEKTSPGNTELKENIEHNIKVKYNLLRAGSQEKSREAYATMTDRLIGGPDGQGAKPKNYQELIGNDPNNEAWFKRLEPSQRQSVLSQLERNAKGEDVNQTPETEARFQELYGKALSGDPKKVQEFLDAKLLTENLPMNQRRQLANAQTKLRAKTDALSDMPVMKAEKMLDSQGVFAAMNMPKTDPRRDKFRAQLQIEIADYLAQNPGTKEINPDTIRKIAQPLIMNVEVPGKYFGTNTKKGYETKSDIPSAAIPVLIRALRQKLGRNPERDEIEQAYEKNKDQFGGGSGSSTQTDDRDYD